MASLKEELKKIIQAQMREITVPSELFKRIVQNLDHYNEAQLIQLLDALYLQKKPELLEPSKETQVHKMMYLKKRLEKETEQIKKITNT